jgi:hypothetical protein
MEKGFVSVTVEGVTEVKDPVAQLKEALAAKMTFLRGTFIGIVVGLVPGAGATIASFVSYGTELQYGRRKSELGTGIPEGHHRAADWCHRIGGRGNDPLVTMGIPGSGATAIILGAFMLHGLQPGPQVFQNSPQIIYAMFASLFVGIIGMCVIGFFAAKLMVKVLDLPEAIVSAYVVMCCFLGAYASRNNVTDLWLLAAFGIVGYLSSAFAFPSRRSSWRDPGAAGGNELRHDDGELQQRLDGVLHAPRERRAHGDGAVALLYPLVRHRLRRAGPKDERHQRRRVVTTVERVNLYRLEVPLASPVQAGVRCGDEIRHDSRRGRRTATAGSDWARRRCSRATPTKRSTARGS